MQGFKKMYLPAPHQQHYYHLIQCATLAVQEGVVCLQHRHTIGRAQ